MRPDIAKKLDDGQRRSVPDSRALMARVWHDYLRPQQAVMAFAALCAILVAIFTGLLGKAVDPSIDLMFQSGKAHPELPLWVTQNPVMAVPVILIGLSLLRLLAQLGMTRSVNKAGHGLVGTIQGALFSNLIRADIERLQKAHSGQYLSSVLYDAGLMREAATNGVINYVQNALIVVTTLIFMATIDWKMTLGVLICGPIIATVLGRYNRATKKAAQGAMAETSSLSSAILESLDGVRIVKINNQEDEESERIAAVIARRQSHIIKGANARATAAPVTELLTQSLLALVIVYAGLSSQSGGISLGGFTAFIILLGMAGQALRQLANLQTVMAEGFTAARRLFEAIDIVPTIVDKPNAVSLSRDFKTIRFDNIGFAYGHDADAASDDKAILSAIDFSIPAGTSVALVGPSGSGKSTLVSLLARFYEPQSGQILFDETDYRAFSLHSLRANIAFVTQDAFLFDDTIAANIAYGCPNATQAMIERAAIDAAAHDFIKDLPNGYLTRVGEAGSRLSGGQKQRIAIARAFLKDAPLLLLDEATSALDSQSERLIQEALERLLNGRTTIIIAHRLSTIQNADQIIVLNEGRIIERGTHLSLMQKDGLYRQLSGVQAA